MKRIITPRRKDEYFFMLYIFYFANKLYEQIFPPSHPRGYKNSTLSRSLNFRLTKQNEGRYGTRASETSEKVTKEESNTQEVKE